MLLHVTSCSILTISWCVLNNDSGINSFPLLSTLHILEQRETVGWWKNNDPLFTDPSNWLYCEFSLSILNFWFSDVLECMCNRSLYSEWFEWVFAVETGWLSRFSTFPFRERVCFKKWFKPLLEKIHFSAHVDNWNGCSPQFDSHCSFLLAVMSSLCDAVSIPLCPYRSFTKTYRSFTKPRIFLVFH